MRQKETDMSTAPKTITAGQTKDLASALLQAIPSDLSADVAQKWIGKKGELQSRITRILLSEDNGKTSTLNWLKAYEMLGMTSEYHSKIATLAISEQEGLWTVPVLKGVTCNKVVVALQKAGCKTWLYRDNLDEEVTQNDRDSNRDGNYAVAFQSNIEADEENKNKSADQLQKSGHKGITLLERLLLELACFLTTGKHLDVKNVTLCTGSRSSDGGAPDVRWGSDRRKVYVRWYYSGYRYDSLRARSVVLCQS